MVDEDFPIVLKGGTDDNICGGGWGLVRYPDSSSSQN